MPTSHNGTTEIDFSLQRYVSIESKMKLRYFRLSKSGNQKLCDEFEKIVQEVFKDVNWLLFVPMASYFNGVLIARGVQSLQSVSGVQVI